MSMLEIEDSFSDSIHHYSFVKNYVYQGNGNLEDFGILKNDSHYAYILQDTNQKDIAYRIYKGFRNRAINKVRDAEMIQNLYSNGRSISDIDFPYGVVSKEGRVIGQVIPYYDGAEELAQYMGDDRVISYIQKAYSLIEELWYHSIYYLDVHEYNFMVTESGLKLIDFDNEMTRFHSNVSGVDEIYTRHIINNFKRMTHDLLGLDSRLIPVDNAKTMSELRKGLLQMSEESPKVKVKK